MAFKLLWDHEIMRPFVLMYFCPEPQCTKWIKVKLFQSNRWKTQRPTLSPHSVFSPINIRITWAACWKCRLLEPFTRPSRGGVLEYAFLCITLDGWQSTWKVDHHAPGLGRTEGKNRCIPDWQVNPPLGLTVSWPVLLTSLPRTLVRLCSGASCNCSWCWTWRGGEQREQHL